MAATKVLVVDDSLTMRALISGALERIPNVTVVGLADGADEAREMTERLRPDVITLDVEMPGTSGLQYLAEVMEKRPMPVIMFSTRTEAGAAETVEALRLGAIECFPKPKVAVPAELDKIIAKLGKCIKAAKGAVRTGPPPSAKVTVFPPIDWNGRLLAVGGDPSSTKSLFDLFATFPANCPPTLVVQHLDPGIAGSMVEKLNEACAATVVMATEGMAIEQGKIYFAPPGDMHMVVGGWPAGQIKMLARDPVAGERPSISVLLASLGKAAGGNGVGVTLVPEAEDGAAGVNALLAAEGYAITPLKAAGAGFQLARRSITQPVAASDLARAVLKLCSK